MGWFIGYGVGAAVMLFVIGVDIGRGSKWTFSQVVRVTLFWPMLLPIILGVAMRGKG